jgi:AraC-like DNA-binding protein
MAEHYVLETGWQILLKDMDISVQDVLYHARLSLDLLSRKSPTITGDEFFRLWDGLAHVLRHEPTFPLRLARAITSEIFSPPIFICLCSRDLNMALDRMALYKPIVGPLRLEIEHHDRHTVVAIRGWPEATLPPPSLIAFELAFCVQVARMATREQINPLSVHVTQELPECDAYQAFFRKSPRRSDFNGLIFSAEDAKKPFLTVNDAMWSLFEPELNKRLQSLTQEATFRERVRACLIEILASGQTSVEDVASRLAMSSRTLQRHLQGEGTSFQKVLDDLREELARHYLATSEYSSGQIAFLLGYEEPNSFYRAFHAWTGQTPEFVRSGGK